MVVSLNSNTTGATSGAETANPSGAPEFIPVYSGFLVAESLAFCVAFCGHFFVRQTMMAKYHTDN